MIRVNLLKKEAFAQGIPQSAAEAAGELESGFDPKQIQRQALVNLVILMIGPLSLYLYEQQTVPSLRSRLNQANQTLGEITAYNTKNEAAVNEIKKFESDRDRIQKQISFLEAISLQRQKEIMLMDLVQQTIPEKTWLKKLEIKTETATAAPDPSNPSASQQKSNTKTFIIDGYSLTDSEVLEFTEKLQRSTLLENVLPKKTVNAEVEKMTVKEFIIEAKVVQR